MIRRSIACILALALAAFAFAACGDSASSAPAESSSASSEAASASPEASSAASSEGSEAPSEAASEVPEAPDSQHDLNMILSTVAEAAGLGETIELRELELTSAGIDLTGVSAWSAVESQMASENGGIVLVFEVDPANVAGLEESLTAFRDAKASDDRYAEYAEAREHTANALIVDNGEDLVIYAVSATGDNDTLGNALAGVIVP